MGIEEYMTVEDAAKSLGVTISAVKNAISDGRLASQKVLGRRVVTAVDVEEYRARTQPGGEKPKGRPPGPKS